MAIPKAARYDKIMDTVHTFFLKEKISSFPIDPFEIIKRNKWGLVTYTELAKEHGTSVEKIIEALQSEDGYVMLDSNNYTIAFNDTVKYPGRIRFTLMHEIGHIELNHLVDFDETILLRSALTKSEYEILEREAHAFARNTLAPAPIIRALESHWRSTLSVTQLKQNFSISNKAAQIRQNMFDWDLQHSYKHRHSLINNFKDYFTGMFYGKQCLKCNHSFAIKDSKFCPICGNQRHKKQPRRQSTMLYTKFSLDDDMRAAQCPKCKNEEVEGNYCRICGSYLYNICTGYDPDNDYDLRNRRWGQHTDGCKEFLDGNARYCYKCGSTTSFLEEGVFEYWNDEKIRHEQSNLQAPVRNQFVSTNGNPFDFSDDNIPF